MTPAIVVHSLSFTYPDGTVALRDVSFSVEEGECVGLIGPNGSGKSTALLHLNGILPESPTGPPCVTVCGVPATTPNLGEIRRSVGLLFQDPDDQLFCPTVFEDVAFGPKQFGVPDLAGVVRSALHRVDLEGYEARSPHHLSGGEKRRVCLAGVLACDAKVLVLDEPTSDLDPRGRRHLAQLLQSLPATKVIATHDLELVVRLCSRVILLDAGAVVAVGPTREILSNESLMLLHGLEKPHILQHTHPHH